MTDSTHCLTSVTFWGLLLTLAAPLTLARPLPRSQAKGRQGRKKLYRSQGLDPAAILATCPLPGHNRRRPFGAGRSEPEPPELLPEFRATLPEDPPAMVPPRKGGRQAGPACPAIRNIRRMGPKRRGRYPFGYTSSGRPSPSRIWPHSGPASPILPLPSAPAISAGPACPVPAPCARACLTRSPA